MGKFIWPDKSYYIGEFINNNREIKKVEEAQEQGIEKMERGLERSKER